MRLLVCGGRDYDDYKLVRKLIKELNPELIIHGAARGADILAGEAAFSLNIVQSVYPADWGQFGKSAGPIRNRQMLEEGQPTLVLALPGGRGTANMVMQAEKARIPVLFTEGKNGS